MATRPPRHRRRYEGYDLFEVLYREFVAELNRLRELKRRELAKLAALHPSKRHARVRKLLRCRQLHVFYAYDALRRCGALGRSTPASVQALAATWNPFTSSSEPIDSYFIRGRARERLVISFRPQRRMHQLMVADLLEALHPPLPNQYLFGGGMPAALAAVEAAIAEGFCVGAELDVSSFYVSVKYDGLVGTLRPLPERVIENVVWDRGIRRNSDDEWMQPLPSLSTSCGPSSSGLVGLAPGAACSSIVGERLIGMLLAQSGEWRTITYADNVFVLGRSREDVSACIQHLRERAFTFETGPLELRQSQIFDLTGPFVFLKQEARQVDGRLDWAPAYHLTDKFLLSDFDERPTLDEIADVEHRIGHWRRSHPWWTSGFAWESRRLGELDALRFYDTGELLSLSRAATALVVTFYHDGSTTPLLDYIPAGRDATERRRADRLLNEMERLVSRPVPA